MTWTIVATRRGVGRLGRGRHPERTRGEWIGAAPLSGAGAAIHLPPDSVYWALQPPSRNRRKLRPVMRRAVRYGSLPTRASQMDKMPSRWSRRQFVQGAGVAGAGLLAGCGRLPEQSLQPA